jgi:hypothetical protein
MTAKQNNGIYAPDGSLYITLTDGAGNLVDVSSGGGGGGTDMLSGQWRNVKDFGAVGDGITDDTANIQKAVYNNGAAAVDGTVWFPKGNYKLTGPILFEAGNLNIKFSFEPGAKLQGNFADALLKRSVNSPIGGVHVIENGTFENDNAAGKCIMLHSCVSGRIANCQLSGSNTALVGIETFNSQSVIIDTCSLIGFTGTGIKAGNATFVLDCDITGCLEGIRHSNIGLVVIGGRFEVNGCAIRLGMDENGDGLTSAGVHISGLSMESNDKGIDAENVSGVSISGVSCARINAGAPGVDLTGGPFGIRIGPNTNASQVSGCNVSGEYPSGYGILVSGNYGTFSGVNAAATGSGAVAWSVDCPMKQVFNACNISQITTITGDLSIYQGTAHRTIYANSASALHVYTRNDAQWNGYRGLPPDDFEWTIIQMGAGQVTVATDGSGTLRAPNGAKTKGQYSVIKLRRFGTDTMLVSGDTAI